MALVDACGALSVLAIALLLDEVDALHGRGARCAEQRKLRVLFIMYILDSEPLACTAERLAYRARSCIGAQR